MIMKKIVVCSCNPYHRITIVKIRCIAVTQIEIFFYQQELSIKCFIGLRPKYIITTASYLLFHKPGLHWKVKFLYCGQATRDVRVLNMHSECKSRAEARPLAAVWGPHIQFLILTLVSQRGVSPSSLLLLPCPPPFPCPLDLWEPQGPPKC